MTNCPFITTFKLQMGLWFIQEALHDHNHPFTHPSAFPMYRSMALDKETEAAIVDLHKKGVRVADILARIDNKTITRQDAYNLIQRHKRRELTAACVKSP